MHVVSTVQRVVPVTPKHNSAPPSASRRATLPAVGDRKSSLGTSSTGTDNRRRSASELYVFYIPMQRLLSFELCVTKCD